MRAIAQFCAIASSLICFHLLPAQAGIPYSSQEALEQPLNVYPNPTHDLLKLKSNSPLDRVTIVNEQGERVMKLQQKALAWNQIDMSRLPAGFYKVRLFTREESRSFTVIKL